MSEKRLAGMLAMVTRHRFALMSMVVILLAAMFFGGAPKAMSASCANPVACENQLTGTPQSQWDISKGEGTTIQGFADPFSVNLGGTINFKIESPASSYKVDIYRMGYYGGDGARLVTSVTPNISVSQKQPGCKTNTATGLVDCSNWGVSASWTVPTTLVSGVYFAHIYSSTDENQIPFVVRSDSSHSDILFKTSDETWQAYNDWGGYSLYTGNATDTLNRKTSFDAGRAEQVSYDRPFATRFDTPSGQDYFFYAEFPMIEFLEENGYDVSYVDQGTIASPQGPSLIEQHKMLMNTGHDEYWSASEVANETAARNAGVNLAFFSGNEVYWKTRFAADAAGESGRTLITYKESLDSAQTDPGDPPVWTGEWADPRFSPPGDGGQPGNALTGQLWTVNEGTYAIQVPATYSKLRLWRNTAAASLQPGQTLTLAPETLGYEWDVDMDNGFQPAGVIDMSATTETAPQVVTDYQEDIAAVTQTHHLTLYRASSGALVFDAGTVQWAWGLNANHDGDSQNPADPNMQQATVNILADMQAQPTTLMSSLKPASASTDTTPPTSAITSPAAGTSYADGAAVTVSGTATDAGGGVVAGVEISTDGGTSWHPVTTMSSPAQSVTWSYSWNAHGSPTTTVETRATDDSGNIETPSDGIKVSVNCPCTIWGNVTPSSPDSGDANSIEVGVKFTSDVPGYIDGIRFYKATTNTGTHIGNLWTASGQQLATATFSSETASGWQYVNFAQPVAISANTTYIASYFAPKGHYAQAEQYFLDPPLQGGSATNAVPLHAEFSTLANPNGVYIYANNSSFPSLTYNAENYWVDVAFTPTAAASPPGQPTNVTATAGYASATVNWTAPTSGSPATSYTVTPYIGTTAQTPVSVAGFPAPTSMMVSGLTIGTAYTFTVTPSNSAGTGPVSAASNSVTPSASIPIVTNGGFESGLSPWTGGGVVLPTVSTVNAHSGAASALLGAVANPEPTGDSSLSQTIIVPSTGTSTLTFWYRPQTSDDICSGSGCVYDWEQAQVRSTSGTTLASIFQSNSNSKTWTSVSYDLTPYAGQTIQLWFNVHEDGGGDPSAMYLDDVSVNNSGGAPTVPGAPTGVTASAGNASASVSWTAPANSGTITGYTVTPYIGSTAQTPVNVSGSTTVTTVSGLTNGTSYTFTVTATNAVGTGPASAASNAVTPTAPAVPGAPTGVTASAGNASASVSWTAPANSGTITGYTVTSYIGSTAQTPVNVSGSTTVTTVSGLTNGTSYTFTVTATNAVGTGPASAASNAVTPTAPTVPAAPANVSASAGIASATVGWTAPANGGSTITGYTVTPYIGSTAQTPVNVSGSTTVTTVSGLTNGTSYTFTVTATNAVGTGPASAASNAVTPTAPTAAFVQQAAAHAGASASLSVTPSANLTTGNRLVVMVGVWAGNHPTAKSVTDTAGDTFTEVQHFTASDGTEMSVWTAPITAGGGTKQAIKVTPSAKADLGIEVLEYSGLSAAAGSAAVDVMSSATGITSSAATVQSGATAATTAAGELALGFYLDSGFGDTLTAGTGFTQRGNVSNTGDMEFLAEDAAEALGAKPNASVGTGAQTTWLMSTVVFKSA